MRALLIVAVIAVLAIAGIYIYQSMQPAVSPQTASQGSDRKNAGQLPKVTHSSDYGSGDNSENSQTSSDTSPITSNTPAAIKVQPVDEQQLSASDNILEEVIASPVDDLTKQAAKQHIEEVIRSPKEAIDISQADHFVTVDQLLELPLQQLITPATTEAPVASVDNAKTFAVNTGPIKATPLKPDPADVRKAAPKKAEESGFSFENIKRKIVTVFSDENGDSNPTPQEVSRTKAATEEAIAQLDNQIKLQALLNNPETAKNQVFFIHAVTGGDDQGLWGIIQNGVIKTFAKGIRIQDRMITANIPRQADERLANRSSSFLGAILDRKVKDTYVYNYQKGILGQNPDLITPGQELIIVSFEEAELIAIYNHFVSQ
ncbi:hypothetical protein [Aliamphritea ceti]|uniref:hypothetical protein n=1 Tax=Aliamphritea ceti TaxID=1524258 RepID=UPI0021C3DC27|nr:hypothetical protein [Aliamphritea ceti]